MREETRVILSYAGAIMAPRKLSFAKERTYIVSLLLIVKPMLYGFGDDKNPRDDTVEIVEEIVVKYIVDLVHKYLFS